MHRKIILFELNEVPWRIVDDYAARSPDGVMATILRRCRQYVTVAPDAGHLSPWRTWPSLHRGVPDHVHLISDLGQDRDAADEAYPRCGGCFTITVRVSVCVAHSTHIRPRTTWTRRVLPPRRVRGGRSSTSSRALEVSSVQPLDDPFVRPQRRHVDLVVPRGSHAPFPRALGILPKTYGAIAAQLAAERRQPHRRSRRRTLQSVLAFDVFMTQLKRTTPDFSTFFSNHVASAMHRYWAATYPADYLDLDLDSDWLETHRDEIPWAMRAPSACSPGSSRSPTPTPSTKSGPRQAWDRAQHWPRVSKLRSTFGPGDLHATSRDARRLLAATARDASANQRHGQ